MLKGLSPFHFFSACGHDYSIFIPVARHDSIFLMSQLQFIPAPASGDVIYITLILYLLYFFFLVKDISLNDNLK